MRNNAEYTEKPVHQYLSENDTSTKPLEKSNFDSQKLGLIQEVRAVAALLHQLESPWWLAGGAAVDLHVGGPFRSHNDIDVVLPRRALGELFSRLRLRGCEFFDEETWRTFDSGSEFQSASSVFVRDMDSQPNLHGTLNVIFLDEEVDGGIVFSSDPSLVFPRSLHHESQEFQFEDGAAVHLVPKEVLLLYKLCERREKDFADIRLLLPTLLDRERERLHHFLRTLGIVFEVNGHLIAAPETLIERLSLEPFKYSKELLAQVAAQERNRVTHAANLIFDCATDSESRETFLVSLPRVFSRDIVDRRSSEFSAAADVLFTCGDGISRDRFRDIFDELFDLSDHFTQLIPRWNVHYDTHYG